MGELDLKEKIKPKIGLILLSGALRNSMPFPPYTFSDAECKFQSRKCLS